jgi:hypothetical protein
MSNMNTGAPYCVTEDLPRKEETCFDMKDEDVFDFIAERNFNLRHERCRMTCLVVTMNKLGIRTEFEELFSTHVKNILKEKAIVVDQFPSDYTKALREIGYFKGTDFRGDKIVNYTGFWEDPPEDRPGKLLALRKTLTWIVETINKDGLNDEIETYLSETWDDILQIKKELGNDPAALGECGFFNEVIL